MTQPWSININGCFEGGRRLVRPIGLRSHQEMEGTLKLGQLEEGLKKE